MLSNDKRIASQEGASTSQEGESATARGSKLIRKESLSPPPQDPYGRQGSEIGSVGSDGEQCAYIVPREVCHHVIVIILSCMPLRRHP